MPKAHLSRKLHSFDPLAVVADRGRFKTHFSGFEPSLLIFVHDDSIT